MELFRFIVFYDLLFGKVYNTQNIVLSMLLKRGFAFIFVTMAIVAIVAFSVGAFTADLIFAGPDFSPKFPGDAVIGISYPTGDFNDDGIVNGADLSSLFANWGECQEYEKTGRLSLADIKTYELAGKNYEIILVFLNNAEVVFRVNGFLTFPLEQGENQELFNNFEIEMVNHNFENVVGGDNWAEFRISSDGCIYDLNNDGIVDGNDVAEFLGNWGATSEDYDPNNVAPTSFFEVEERVGIAPARVKFIPMAFDEDGSIASHEWAIIGGGQAILRGGAGEPYEITESFEVSGEYRVDLKVTDNQGDYDIYTRIIDVL